MDKQIKNLWYYIHGVLFSLRKKEILPFATAQGNLEDIMVSENKPHTEK